MSCTVRYSVKYIVLTVHDLHQKLDGVLHDRQVILMLRHVGESLKPNVWVYYSIMEQNTLVLLDLAWHIQHVS